MAKKNRSTQTATPASAPVETTPVAPAQVTPAPANGERITIKSVIMAGINAGLGTKEIGAQLAAQFPNSAAARKADKHVAWYRSRQRQIAKAALALNQAQVAAQPAAK